MVLRRRREHRRRKFTTDRDGKKVRPQKLGGLTTFLTSRKDWAGDYYTIDGFKSHCSCPRTPQDDCRLKDLGPEQQLALLVDTTLPYKTAHDWPFHSNVVEAVAKTGSSLCTTGHSPTLTPYYCVYVPRYRQWSRVPYENASVFKVDATWAAMTGASCQSTNYGRTYGAKSTVRRSPLRKEGASPFFTYPSTSLPTAVGVLDAGRRTRPR